MKKKKQIIIEFVVIFAVVAAVFILVNVIPRMKVDQQIAEQLEKLLDNANISMKLELSAETDNHNIDVAAGVRVLTIDKTRYVEVETEGQTFYLAEGMLILSGGKAYRVTDHAIATSTQDAGTFLEVIKKFKNYDIKITDTNGEIDYIEISGDLDWNGNIIKLSVRLSDIEYLSGKLEIPENIRETVATIDKDSLVSITGDLFRLMLGFVELSNRDFLHGMVELRADCGIISFQNEYDLSALKEGIEDLSNSKEIETMPELIAGLCMEGELSCEETTDGYVYELQLEEESMQKLSQIIAPDIVNQVVNLENGQVIINMDESVIHSMEISIGGKVTVLFVEVDAGVGAKFIFE